MNNYRDLKRGLAQMAKRVESEKLYATNPELKRANEKALYLFSHPAPVMGRYEDGYPINITYRSLWRVNWLLRRNGIDWPNFNFQALLDWLYENWDKVLRVMLSLLALILI
jgi:hypothetical protein